jgi:hypothetical protein
VLRRFAEVRFEARTEVEHRAMSEEATNDDGLEIKEATN